MFRIKLSLQMGIDLDIVAEYPIEKLMLYQAYDALEPFGSHHMLLSAIAAHTERSSDWERFMPAGWRDFYKNIDDSSQLNTMRQNVARSMSVWASLATDLGIAKVTHPTSTEPSR